MLMVNYPCADYIIGTAREIRSTYKKLKEKTVYNPLFVDFPKFNSERMYGIKIDLETNWFMVISETDVVYLLMGKVKKGGN